MNINKNLKIGLAFVLFSGGILVGQNLTINREKKAASQSYKEQLDIRTELKNTVPPDEFLRMEKRIGDVVPPKKIANIFGLEICSPIRRTIDYKYFQDSVAHQQEIWQKALQNPDCFDELLDFFDKLWRVKK